MSVTRTQAIKNFLTASTQTDLANLYNYDMECQVNVAQDGGERTEGDYKGKNWHGWTDGLTTWKSFRIPRNANTVPEYDDTIMSYDLAEHAEGIGMTGWDWKNRVARWVAFDFDAITGHTGVGISDQELQHIRKLASEIPWVTVRKSTSGQGLHLYVFLDAVPTENHNEHAALARAVLGMMSAITGYDFHGKVDACGGNMWVWHRKMKGTDGLTLLKQGTVLYDIPANWKDHVKVVSGKRRKVLPTFVEDSNLPDAEKLFEELTGQRTIVQLDDDHKKLIAYIQEQNGIWWWDSDNHMLVCHTYILKKAHEELSLKGVFQTTSEGSDLDTQNCFLYPIRNGGWVVRRFTPGVAEAPTWDQDSAGWTRCYFNREPDLRTAARTFDGIEHEKGGYVFQHVELAVKAAQQLGTQIAVPNWIAARKCKLKPHKDGRIIMEIPHEDHDKSDEMVGWLNEKGVWKRIYNANVSSPGEPEVGNYDDLIRHLVTEANDDCGWTIKEGKEWRTEPLQHIKLSLKSMDFSPKEVDNILGSNILKCWKLVNKPFQPEYPGDRQWNRYAAQFKYALAENLDALSYPTWTKILEHCGHGLDEAVSQHPWCQANGIITGGDYLKCWIASLFQEPSNPLPYLFFYGPQNSGKSIFHEALALLVTRGYQRADVALTSQSSFNGELENAIICVVEETDLRKNNTAYNRIKDWVTSRHLPIRHLYKTAYLVPNTTHWIQCANEAAACPVFTGDTRITMAFVESIPKDMEIPKKELIPRLEKEASDFLSAVLHLEIPKSIDRLNIPVLVTHEKLQQQAQNQTTLEQFIDENCFYVEGSTISVAEFFEHFTVWLEPNEAMQWTKIRLGKEMPPQFPKGRLMSDGNWYFGNISWNNIPAVGPKYFCIDKKLVCGRSDETV